VFLQKAAIVEATDVLIPLASFHVVGELDA